MSHKILVFAVLLLSTAFAADFSGSWTLNREKSELGEGPGARMAATKMVVEQKENALKIESTRQGRDGGERTRTTEMTLDGAETKSSTNFGESVTTATIEDDVLTIHTTRTFERDGQVNEMKVEQKWTLTEEGKVLIVEQKSNSPWGENEVKLSYDKN
jgi:hypothetical protein